MQKPKLGLQKSHEETLIRSTYDNGERLCEMCNFNELVITGTFFHQMGRQRIR